MLLAIAAWLSQAQPTIAPYSRNVYVAASVHFSQTPVLGVDCAFTSWCCAVPSENDYTVASDANSTESKRSAIVRVFRYGNLRSHLQQRQHLRVSSAP